MLTNALSESLRLIGRIDTLLKGITLLDYVEIGNAPEEGPVDRSAPADSVRGWKLGALHDWLEVFTIPADMPCLPSPLRGKDLRQEFFRRQFLRMGTGHDLITPFFLYRLPKSLRPFDKLRAGLRKS
jgi:hypothetical protein